MNMTYAALIYPLVYVLLDRIYVIFGTKLTIYLMLFSVFLDGFVSFLIYSASFFPIDSTLSMTDMAHTNSIHNLSYGIISLFWHGLLGSIIAYTAELLFFSFLYQKIFKNNFIFSSILSICTTLFIHNVISDYNMFSDSTNRWNLILSNYIINVSMIIIYSIIIGLIRTKNKTAASKG